MVFQCRAARKRRGQQNLNRKQMRLGREESRLCGTRAAIGGRAGHTVHGGFRQEQYQRGEGILQSGGRYQEADY